MRYFLRKKVIAIDPAYKKLGLCIGNEREYELIYIVNRIPTNNEDIFLSKLYDVLRKFRGEFLIYEYTPVPRFKSSSPINRTIGVMLASLSKGIKGYLEINMSTIYSAFNIKGKKDKKKALRELAYKSLPNTLKVKTIEIYEKGIKEKKESLDKRKIPEDCIDAYMIYQYALRNIDF